MTKNVYEMYYSSLPFCWMREKTNNVAAAAACLSIRSTFRRRKAAAAFQELFSRIFNGSPLISKVIATQICVKIQTE